MDEGLPMETDADLGMDMDMNMDMDMGMDDGPSYEPEQDFESASTLLAEDEGDLEESEGVKLKGTRAFTRPLFIVIECRYFEVKRTTTKE